jgi:hypothetical protein
VAEVGGIFTNPDLAATYERIGRLGASEFYEGAIAQDIVDTVCLQQEALQHPIRFCVRVVSVVQRTGAHRCER